MNNNGSAANYEVKTEEAKEAVGFTTPQSRNLIEDSSCRRIVGTPLICRRPYKKVNNFGAIRQRISPFGI